jgi:hypothetical protein
MEYGAGDRGLGSNVGPLALFQQFNRDVTRNALLGATTKLASARGEPANRCGG